MILLTTTPTWLWILPGAGAAGATGLALFKSGIFRREFEELMRDQITMDELNRAAVVRWIKKNRGSETVQVLLVKCTEKYLSKLGYKPPKELDAEHNLLLIMTVKDSDRVLKIQLVSFGSMERELQAKFKGEDELLITD